MATMLKGTIGGGLIFTASPATKNSFTMTAGFYSDYRNEFDQQIWEYDYGLNTTHDGKKIGSITPQSIGTFKITDIFIEEFTTSAEDGSDEENTYSLSIRANHKCLLSFKGRTYRVDGFRDNFYYYITENYDFHFTDGEKVEITYELL